MNIYFWFWSFANQKYQKVRKSWKWKGCLVLSITVDTWPWMPDKSGAVSGAKACRAPKLLKKPARKAGKSKASKLSTVRLFSQKFTNFSINSKTKAYLLQGHLPTVVMTTSKLILQDVIAAISLFRGVLFQNNQIAAILMMFQANPVGFEPLCYINTF